MTDGFPEDPRAAGGVELVVAVVVVAVVVVAVVVLPV